MAAYLLLLFPLPHGDTGRRSSCFVVLPSLYRHSGTLGHDKCTLKPCKTRQPSVEFRTDRQSYSESDGNNYEPYLLQSRDQMDKHMSLAAAILESRLEINA